MSRESRNATLIPQPPRGVRVVTTSPVPASPPPGFASVPSLADELRDALRRRATSLRARTRVQEAISTLAMDILGSQDSLSDADRQWLRRQISGPVWEATEEALNVLLDELALALRSAPARVRPSI